MLWEDIPGDWQNKMQKINANSIHCNADNLVKDMAYNIINICPLRCYTINDQLIAKKLFNWGVDAIFTDYPERFITDYR